MDRKIQVLQPGIPHKPSIKRVGAYARVSSDKDEMLHSLSTQISYYQKLIQSHNDWKFCGVFADEAFTGTKENREKFQEMLEECRKGNIDMVLTKSISRFARNTVTLLSIVRELKALDVDVFFEEQNIHSMSGDGELMLSILASYAQEESLSVSENQKWRVQANFKEGKPWNCKMLGYKYDGEKLIIVPDEAKAVKFVFRAFLEGKGRQKIAKTLNEMGFRGKNGKEFIRSSITRILQNYAYTGSLILQKTYVENHITKKKCYNNGVLPMYHAECTHEAIISLEDFYKVQDEIRRRSKIFKGYINKDKHPLTGIVICGACGKRYIRKTKLNGFRWMCATYEEKGKKHCNAQIISDDALVKALVDIDLKSIRHILVEENKTLKIAFIDGTETVRHWTERSRSESWTEEMRAKARENAKRRYQ